MKWEVKRWQDENKPKRDELTNDKVVEDTMSMTVSETYALLLARGELSAAKMAITGGYGMEREAALQALEKAQKNPVFMEKYERRQIMEETLEKIQKAGGLNATQAEMEKAGL